MTSRSRFNHVRNDWRREAEQMDRRSITSATEIRSGQRRKQLYVIMKLRKADTKHENYKSIVMPRVGISTKTERFCEPSMIMFVLRQSGIAD